MSAASLYDIPAPSHHRRSDLPRRLPRQGPAHRQRRLQVRPHPAVRGPRKALPRPTSTPASTSSASPPTTSAPRSPAPTRRSRTSAPPPTASHFPMFSKIAVTGPDTHPLYQIAHRRPTQAAQIDDARLPRQPRRLSRQHRHNGATTNPAARHPLELREVPHRSQRQRHRPLRPRNPPRRPRITTAIEAAL